MKQATLEYFLFNYNYTIYNLYFIYGLKETPIVLLIQVGGSRYCGYYKQIATQFEHFRNFN